MRDEWANPLLLRSLDPMLLLDDRRRCVDANAAACLFLRQPVETARTLTLDDLTCPALRPGLDATWSLVLRGEKPLDDFAQQLRMPNGTNVAASVSITPRVGPGRHLASIRFAAARERLVDAAPPTDKLLTKREREILTLVALGNTGVAIASQLFLSPATVQTHVVNALVKLGAKNRSHAVALALQNNEIELEHAIIVGRAGSHARAHSSSLQAGSDSLRRLSTTMPRTAPSTYTASATSDYDPSAATGARASS